MEKQYKLLKALPHVNVDDVLVWKYVGLVSEGDGRVIFTTYELEHYPAILDEWLEEIKPKSVYDLEEGEKCWTIGFNTQGMGEVIPIRLQWRESMCKRARSLGMIFTTQEECTDLIARLEAQEVLRRDAERSKVDMHTAKEAYMVHYDYESQKLKVSYWHSWRFSPYIFATFGDAKKSMKEHKAEWLAYLGVKTDAE